MSNADATSSIVGMETMGWRGGAGSSTPEPAALAALAAAVATDAIMPSSPARQHQQQQQQRWRLYPDFPSSPLMVTTPTATSMRQGRFPPLPVIARRPDDDAPHLRAPAAARGNEP